MPKLINHEARRADLVHAAGELIAERGSHAATVRAIANRACAAAGSVRFIFPTQEELLSAVASDIVARAEADVDLRTRHYRKPDMAPSRLAAALPITGEAKAVWRVERELGLGAQSYHRYSRGAVRLGRPSAASFSGR
ncbi:TetR family transcriptional regulator [Microbacterium maritypicum]